MVYAPAIHIQSPHRAYDHPLWLNASSNPRTTWTLIPLQGNLSKAPLSFSFAAVDRERTGDFVGISFLRHMNTNSTTIWLISA
ncbi:hypothetical protein K1719_043027 [Acacia pycnantha]|nr:hypothetical protein K1719_043027 [Acacia pycnantha]